MELKIVINLDNAAFEKHGTDIELGRILTKFADSVTYVVLEPDYGNFHDINENKVGTWEIVEPIENQKEK